MIREDILKAATTCVCGQREEDYGLPEQSFEAIAKYWSCWLGIQITTHDVPIMMTLMKIARIETGKIKDDNYIDACGYMACAAEIGLKKKDICLSEPETSFTNITLKE